MAIVGGLLVVVLFLGFCFALLAVVGAMVAVPARWLRERTEYDLRRPDREEAEQMIREWLAKR
jgi:hypothetical protein